MARKRSASVDDIVAPGVQTPTKTDPVEQTEGGQEVAEEVGQQEEDKVETEDKVEEPKTEPTEPTPKKATKPRKKPVKAEEKTVKETRVPSIYGVALGMKGVLDTSGTAY